MDRHENSLASDLDREMGDPVAEITAFARPTFVVLHLFAGRRRQGDLEHYIMLRAAELDVQVRVVSLDVQIDAKKGDLSDPRVISFWMDEIRKGRVLALFAGPPAPRGPWPGTIATGQGRGRCAPSSGRGGCWRSPSQSRRQSTWATSCSGRR